MQLFLFCICGNHVRIIMEQIRAAGKRFHCQHCNEKVSKTLYYQHKKLYYNEDTKSWSKESPSQLEDNKSEGEEFTFSDSDTPQVESKCFRPLKMINF